MQAREVAGRFCAIEVECKLELLAAAALGAGIVSYRGWNAKAAADDPASAASATRAAIRCVDFM